MRKTGKNTIAVVAWLVSLPVLAGGLDSTPVIRAPASTVTSAVVTPAKPVSTAAKQSADYHRGEIAYDAGNYDKARNIWLPLAEQDYLRAIYAIGRLYEKGRGVDRDFTEALKWYRKAAEKGHADSQYRLSVGYGYGLGVRKDEAVAMEWLRKAAENGQKRAQKSLAKGYEDGLFGLPRDPEQAKHWYDRSKSRE